MFPFLQDAEDLQAGAAFGVAGQGVEIARRGRRFRARGQNRIGKCLNCR
jgi:hypothetical protein